MIVPVRPRARALMLLLAGAWLLSLVLVGVVVSRLVAPELPQLREEARGHAEALEQAQAELATLRQRVATLTRSDEISRRANVDLQQGLSEREEEIAQLRSDVAFYERLVGSTGQRRGLSVHSVQMRPGENGIWNYSVTLTQNLNRGATTTGSMRLAVEGVRDGRMVTLGWDDLASATDGAPAFSFRYFQQVEGSVLLPEDFAPQRVQVILRSDAGNSQQAFPWAGTLPDSASATGR